MMRFKNPGDYENSFLRGDECKANEWLDYFFGIAKMVAIKSKDPNTKVGCIVIDPDSKRILTTGYNGFPSKVSDDAKRWKDRETKNCMVVHAEANCICSGSRFGIKLQGGIMMVTLHPCVDCSKLVASAGISEVIYIDSGIDANPTREWHEKLHNVKTMFLEAGIKLIPVID